MVDEEDIGGPDHTELVIALVAAVGTDLEMVSSQIKIELNEYRYETLQLKLSEYLAEEAGQDFAKMPFDEALWGKMTAGDHLRQEWDRGDALALHAISDIVATRHQRAGGAGDDELAPAPTEPTDVPTDQRAGGAGDDVPPPLDRTAFLLRSLKTQDELTTLRAVYGPRLIVVGAYSPKEARIKHLATKIEESRGTKDRTKWVRQPEELVERDEKEEGARGQDVSGTFHRADFFIRGSDRDETRADIERIFEILFGSPFRTPTRDEHGQFLAAGASLRSAELGRQVGAAIVTREGSVLAVGANEVPKAGGGSHWEEDGAGNRDFEIGEIDTNRAQFEDLASRLTDRVVERVEQLLGEGDESVAHGYEDLAEQLRAALPDDLRAGGLKDLTEFGRAVHAEMNALLDALRRGVSVQGATVHATTFPCHNCARHIVGAGIARVVFIEPYPKSRAETLHADSMSVDVAQDGGKVSFEPFVGVAPRKYRELFDAAAREELGHPPRKDSTGRKAAFAKPEALPIFSDAGLAQLRPEARDYRAKEFLALEHFRRHRS